jgi:hypothetical protein
MEKSFVNSRVIINGFIEEVIDAGGEYNIDGVFI